MSDFRIILHMHYLFEDHRSSCRLFITSKIKTINDLQQHISNLFDLKTDFYLISNNLYLPHLEDVRVLREDDLVIAIPCNRRVPNNAICSPQTEVTNFRNFVVDKPIKRSRAVLIHEIESENCDLPEQGVVKKKKKRKVLESDCGNNEPIIVEGVVKKRKKKKELSTESNDFEENHFNEASNLIVNDQEDGDVFKKEKKKEKKAPVYNPRFPCIVSRKNIELMEISTKPKVVKSIFVNDLPRNLKKKNPTPETLLCDNYNNNYKSVERNNEQAFNDESLKIKNSVIGTKNGKIHFIPKNEENHSENDLTTTFPPANDTNESLTTNLNEKINIISVQTCNENNNEKLLPNEGIGPQLIPLNAAILPLAQLNSFEEKDELECVPNFKDHTYSAQTSLLEDDLVFKEPSLATPSESIVSTATEESGVDGSMSETKRRRKRVRKRKQKNKPQENGFQAPVVFPKPVFTSAAPALHIRFENDNQNEPNTNSEVSEVADYADSHFTQVIDNNINYDKFCKEEILQYPIMNEKLPKKADVIAFKICRLSESYTPEISDVIIAKVLNYCPTTNNVVLKLLEGADECLAPEGKFYMEIGDNDVEEKEKCFLWNELIEPRLLFP